MQAGHLSAERRVQSRPTVLSLAFSALRGSCDLLIVKTSLAGYLKWLEFR